MGNATSVIGVMTATGLCLSAAIRGPNPTDLRLPQVWVSHLGTVETVTTTAARVIAVSTALKRPTPSMAEVSSATANRHQPIFSLRNRQCL